MSREINPDSNPEVFRVCRPGYKFQYRMSANLLQLSGQFDDCIVAQFGRRGMRRHAGCLITFPGEFSFGIGRHDIARRAAGENQPGS